MTKNKPKNTLRKGSKYTPEIVDKILDKIIAGKLLKEICKPADMPSVFTVMKWIRKYDDFRREYFECRAIGMLHLADEILEIADDRSEDKFTAVHHQSGREYEAPNLAAVNRARLRIDTRKFLMAKLMPRVFGERTQLEVDQTIRELPQVVTITQSKPPEIPDKLKNIIEVSETTMEGSNDDTEND